MTGQIIEFPAPDKPPSGEPPIEGLDPLAPKPNGAIPMGSQAQETDEEKEARIKKDCRAADARRRLGRDETDEEREKREGEDQAADADAAARKAALAEIIAKFNQARREMPPAKFARFHLEMLTELKPLLRDISEKRRAQGLAPHARFEAARERCDRLIRQRLAALPPDPPADPPGLADSPDHADDEADWRVKAGKSSGPPPKAQNGESPVGAGLNQPSRKLGVQSLPPENSDFPVGAKPIFGAPLACARGGGRR